MNIFITGGCGYVGTVLTNFLLKEKKNKITVFDSMWFGNFLIKHKNLTIIKDELKNIKKYSLNNYDCVIHLANISNDPGVELNPNLSWEVNVLSTYQLIEKSVQDGVKKFIFASSGSVYGIKKDKNVTEDLSLVPISAYNKTKMIAERVIMSFKDSIKTYCIRPATICGYSPKMRLDLTVNLLTMQALTNKKITVFGGKQTRPNININDMVRVYDHFLSNKNIKPGFYNAGFENYSIAKIAKIIKKKIKCSINVLESNDPRSYRQNSDKLLNTGFNPKFNIENAIDELIEKFNEKKLIKNDLFYNIKTMKKLKL